MRRMVGESVGDVPHGDGPRAVSVSLGSRRRDYQVAVCLLDQVVRLERQGCDGDVEEAERRIAALDGQADAIGLGGLDVYLYVAGDRYVVADGERLLRVAKRTPVVDGSGLKATLEPSAVRWLAAHGPFALTGAAVLMVSALDRYGMAVALEAAGCRVVYGDLMFGAGIPYPITSLPDLQRIARKLAREITRLPVRLLYPTGQAQEQPSQERFPEAYAQADVIAGDFHLIRRYLPARLDGKAIVTNTTTRADRADLAARGVRWLCTTTPLLAGRSLGTNALEAAMLAARGPSSRGMERADFESLLQAIDYRPEVLDLSSGASWRPGNSG